MKIRSKVLFISMFIVWTIFFVLGSPLLLLPKRVALQTCQSFGHVMIFLLRVIGGVRTEIRGLEKLPKGGYILASKHQSEWETFVIGYMINWPMFVIKKELLSVPFFGWFMRRSGLIAVDRKATGGVMRQMVKQALPLLAENKVIVIFPEGTRTKPGVRSKYKGGIAALYTQANVPVVPVAINAGVFWAKNVIHKKGTAVLEILDIIPAGLPSEEFLSLLENKIEDASMRLYEEAQSKS